MPQQKRPAQGPKRRPAPAARSSNMQRRRAVSRKQNRRVHALITLIFCIAVFILVCAGCFLLVKTDGTITNKPNQSQGDSSSAAPDGADSTTDGDSQQEQPTMTEEEQRIADATATASAKPRWDSLQRRSIMTGGCWPGRAMASTLPASGIPICSTLCRITASTRTISSTTSSTSWAPRPAWAVSGCWSVM